MPILLRCAAALLAFCDGLQTADANPGATPASTTAAAMQLRQRHAEAAEALRGSPFGRALVLESADEDGRLRGEVLAALDLPFAQLRDTLDNPQAWCEVLLLTPNVPGCQVEAGVPVRLALALSRRFDQPASETRHQAAVDFHVNAAAGDYIDLHLGLDEGPLGTRDYRLEVEAVALDAQRSVLFMRYAYRYGLRARLALNLYLATGGSGKSGFTPLPDDPGHVGGMRGSVERNVMRYYLAIDARAMQSATEPAQLRFARSLDTWLAAIAEFPLQLAESETADYRTAKLAQFGEAQVADAR